VDEIIDKLVKPKKLTSPEKSGSKKLTSPEKSESIKKPA
jgi:hypothetical protein